jgi:FtsP/CotA-like multicopper oxidase with cupredoxin domain
VYNVSIENQFGTFWYHSHYGTQYLDGIIGPIVIHGPEEAEMRKLYDGERVVLLQDWYHDFSTVNLAKYLAPNNENTEPIPDNGLFNGMGYFNCSKYDGDSSANYTCYDNSTYTVFDLEPNSRTRFRFINTGAFTEFYFSADNHTLSVIEADSTLVEPITVHRVPIHVAQRYSVIVTANQSTSTNYWIRADMMTNCFTGSNSMLDTTTLAVMSYSGNSTIMPSNTSMDWTDALPAHCQDLDANSLSPYIARTPPEATRMWRMEFSFGIGAYQLDRAKFNGTSWSPLTNSTTLQEAVTSLGANASTMSTDGQVGGFSSGDQYVLGVSDEQIDVVDILLYSLDEGSHPFHLHGHVMVSSSRRLTSRSFC